MRAEGAAPHCCSCLVHKTGSLIARVCRRTAAVDKRLFDFLLGAATNARFVCADCLPVAAPLFGQLFSHHTVYLIFNLAVSLQYWTMPRQVTKLLRLGMVLASVHSFLLIFLVASCSCSSTCLSTYFFSFLFFVSFLFIFSLLSFVAFLSLYFLKLYFFFF